MKNQDEQLFSLNEISEGNKVLIKDIKDSAIKNDLGKLGIFVENEIYVSKVAIFGSPISLRTQDSEIAIRKDVAELIKVQKIF